MQKQASEEVDAGWPSDGDYEEDKYNPGFDLNDDLMMPSQSRVIIHYFPVCFFLGSLCGVPSGKDKRETDGKG